jgi:signal transduction histidine kinase
MVGNLLDNACKWSARRVSVVAKGETTPSPDGRPWLLIEVGDDGPGLPEEKRGEALKRGRRLDETKPGSGLGLSIVAETAGMYNGSVVLGQAELGGLLARLRLPAVA